MRKLIVEIAAASALTLAAALALASQARACPAIKVSGAFARASATPQATSGALYFTLDNESGGAIRLVSLKAAGADRAMLHQTTGADGSASMSAVESVEIAPKDRLILAPGGMHAMLMGLTKPLKKGETVGLTLTFADGCSMTLDVPIGSVAQASAEGG
jgi:hypothetical protein